MEFGLPFEAGHEILISQGFHGPWSHKELAPNFDLTYSVDFAVPLGTTVLAAEAGETIMVYDMSEKSYRGVDPQVGNKLPFGVTNFIFIEHVGGVISVYSHLAKSSALVVPGQRVALGQEIAKTGLSGWVGPKPHLHFQVFERDSYKSLPFKFKGYEGPLEHSRLGIRT